MTTRDDDAMEVKAGMDSYCRRCDRLCARRDGACHRCGGRDVVDLSLLRLLHGQRERTRE